MGFVKGQITTGGIRQILVPTGESVNLMRSDFPCFFTASIAECLASESEPNFLFQTFLMGMFENAMFEMGMLKMPCAHFG